MTLDLGNVDAGITLYIPFHTFDSNGASITITGLAITDIEIYKNGSVTQRSSDAGYALLDTDGIDFDGITGIHGFSIDLADNTDAGFYSAGAFYWVVVSAITVDTRTINFVAATFRIGPVAANVTQWLGTAAATPTVAGVPEVDVTHLGGAAQSATDLKDFADDGYDPATNKVEGVKLADTLTTYTGNTVQTGDSFARLGAPAGASHAADIAAIEAHTDDIGIAGAGLTALGDVRLANLDATVSSRLATAGYTAPPSAAVVADAVLDEDMTAHQTQGSLGQAIGDPVADTNTIYKAVVTDAAGATVGVDVVAVKAETASIQSDTNDIQTRIPAALVSGRMDSSVGAMAAGVIAAATFAANALDAVWSTAARILTAGTNIVLAKGVGVTGFNDVSAAQVNAEVVDALNVDTYAETSGVPAATATIVSKLSRLYDALIDKLDVIAAKKKFYNNAGVQQWEKDLTDDGTTYSETAANAP